MGIGSKLEPAVNGISAISKLGQSLTHLRSPIHLKLPNYQKSDTAGHILANFSLHTTISVLPLNHFRRHQTQQTQPRKRRSSYKNSWKESTKTSSSTAERWCKNHKSATASGRRRRLQPDAHWSPKSKRTQNWPHPQIQTPKRTKTLQAPRNPQLQQHWITNRRMLTCRARSEASEWRSPSSMHRATQSWLSGWSPNAMQAAQQVATKRARTRPPSPSLHHTTPNWATTDTAEFLKKNSQQRFRNNNTVAEHRAALKATPSSAESEHVPLFPSPVPFPDTFSKDGPGIFTGLDVSIVRDTQCDEAPRVVLFGRFWQ